MKKIVYTVCSANHLAHCKTMADSFVQFNSGYELFIILIDQVNERFNLNSFSPYSILEISKLDIPDFDLMAGQYSVIELNCAMKPFVAKWLFEQFHPDILLYIDSDTWVFSPFVEVEKSLLEYDLVITPHFTNAYPDNELLPRERDILRSGLYNAGFLGMRNSANTHDFLNWWAGHMRTECYYNFAEGMGVDQIWINLVPLLFNQVQINQDPGLNMAYWNLHERTLHVKDGLYWVNNNHPLVFLHISGYQFNTPFIISKHQNRYSFADHGVLEELFAIYTTKVKENGFDFYSNLACAYAIPKKKSRGIMKTLNQFIKPLGIKITDL
ncbi:hypothetical protein [Sediminibacterium sp.]|uniref:hypothetical protein n=1 Tax=Sediminibacterium sp. TaxID=1917865 RepID=UPI0027373D40|nr:hypothetical protein [Sediminibacterium sp.]MDP3393592.1 hypothetical protein [Sediminibacterium sp.]MDP3566636.1 hypothetical protein [Sediminibacterium sp.]